MKTIKKLTFPMLLLLIASSVLVSCSDNTNPLVNSKDSKMILGSRLGRKSDLNINSSHKVDLSGDKLTFTVDVSSGRDFDCALVSKDGNWLTYFSPTNDAGHYPAGADIAFFCKAQDNTTGEDRTALLLFKNSDLNTYTDTVYVTQSSGMLTIHLKKPGTLAKEISDRSLDPLKIKGLRLTGPLDNNDVLVLRQMAGLGRNRQDLTKGELFNLDIEGVTFVNDGTPAYFLAGGNMAGEIDKVNLLPDYMFAYCPQIQKIKLPVIINKIGWQAFYGCRLNDVTFPKASLETIGYEAFDNCKLLKNVILPEGLQKISKHAFDGSGLVTVTIPKSIKLIDTGSFQDCESLSSVIINVQKLTYQLIIPGSNPFDVNGHAILYVPKGMLKNYTNPDFKFVKYFKNRIQEQQ